MGLAEKYSLRTDLPVVVIHNLDPAWEAWEIEEDEVETKILVDAMIELGHPVQDICIQTAELASSIQEINPDEQLIFNWCEELPGIPHSEYKVAEILDQMGFTYTGTGTQGLILSQDKRRIKRLLRQAGVPTPTWKVYPQGRTDQWERFPAIVKPAFEHCGFGIDRESVVQTHEELIQRLHFVHKELQQPAIVEDFIDGREFHVGAIGNDDITVLPAAEIDYSAFDDIHDRLCTYEANFDKTSRAYQMTIPKLPVDLSADEITLMDKIVISAYQATDCRDYARMDIRLQDGVFYLLDVNHNADISSDNSLVRGAALAGLSYGQLGSLLVNLAAERHPRFKSGSSVN